MKIIILRGVTTIDSWNYLQSDCTTNTIGIFLYYNYCPSTINNITITMDDNIDTSHVLLRFVHDHIRSFSLTYVGMYYVTSHTLYSVVSLCQTDKVTILFYEHNQLCKHVLCFDLSIVLLNSLSIKPFHARNN